MIDFFRKPVRSAQQFTRYSQSLFVQKSEKMKEQNGSSKPRVAILSQTNYLLSLMTILRNNKTETPAFVSAFENVAIQLVGEG